MKNSQIAIDTLKTLEKEHINLYHDVSKDEILDYLAGIENLDELSDIEFDHVMLKMFAKFKDAHTSYFIPNKSIDKKIIFLNGKFYINYNEDWKEIKKFGNESPEEVYNKIREISNFETEEWLNYRIPSVLRNIHIWNMLGLDKTVITSSGEMIEINPFNSNNTIQKKHEPFYSYKGLDGVLYIKYRKCQNEEGYPFETFVKDVKKFVEENNISEYILDLRGNTGGNSEIINPFQDFVRERKLKGVLLIDNGVFSSGRFAVAGFKKEFNTVLIGQPTGGAAKSYGYIKDLEIGGKKFSAAIRFWDFSDIFGYDGAIQPDIFVKETIEDIKNERDKTLEVALKEIQKMNENAEKIDSGIEK